MSHIERPGAVSDRDTANDRLREAFQAQAEAAGGRCSEEDLDRIRRALAGELPASERRDLIDRLAGDPALAEAWRIAAELRSATSTGESAPAAPERRRLLFPPRAWLAAAAALFVVAAGVVVIQRSQPEGNDTFRASDKYVVKSLVAEDAALPRDAFRLRWTPGPPEARYLVRVTTDDLQVLTVAADLTMPELVIGPEVLSRVAPGARVLWQVEVTLPGGERISSQTFTTRVE
jgi:hypothetical protein